VFAQAIGVVMDSIGLQGLHSETLEMMKDLIPAAVKRDIPMAFVSGPSFAKVGS
jgi:glycerol-3-phosphate dehydrogenase